MLLLLQHKSKADLSFFFFPPWMSLFCPCLTLPQLFNLVVDWAVCPQVCLLIMTGALHKETIKSLSVLLKSVESNSNEILCSGHQLHSVTNNPNQ